MAFSAHPTGTGQGKPFSAHEGEGSFVAVREEEEEEDDDFWSCVLITAREGEDEDDEDDCSW